MHEPTGPFLVAHRGASEEAPENTLPAFERGLEAGAPVLECDVHLSADGVPVVIHDPTLDRTCGVPGRVARSDWSRLEGLEAAYRQRFGDRFAGTRLPRLEELLELAHGRAQVMVEIKREAVDRTGAIERAVLGAADATGTRAELGVISMSLTALLRVRALAPTVPVGFVLRRAGGRDAPRRCREHGVELLIGPSSRWLRQPRFLRRARDAGLRLGAYVVNDSATLRALVSFGVESLATDLPREMAPLLGSIREEGA